MNSETTFAELGLNPSTLEVIKQKGFEFASEIQAKSIPIILEGKHDIVGIAQTGTGKTAAFGLPLMEKISPETNHIKCIVLAPTRELALQVTNEMSTFKGNKKLKLLTVYGGQPITQQIRSLRQGVDIVVGTPGRVMDLIKRKILSLNKLDFFVLDEADEMLKMGFIDDIESIMKEAPEDKKVFLYSATMPPKIKSLSKKYMKDQIILEVKSKSVKRDNIKQFYYKLRRPEKLEAIKNIIAMSPNFHGIIFCQTKVIVNEISDELKRAKMEADCIHGDIAQSVRERILQKFKSKNLNVLIATDVAARGIDVDGLTHVINYSLPNEIDSYVHRIGRTGRAGKKGTAITFIDNREEGRINRLKKITNNDIVLGTPPSQKEVSEKKNTNLQEELSEIINDKKGGIYKDLGQKLLQDADHEQIVAALIYNLFGPIKPNKPVQDFSNEKSSFGGQRLGRRRSSFRGNSSGGGFSRGGGNRSGGGRGKFGGGGSGGNSGGKFSPRKRR